MPELPELANTNDFKSGTMKMVNLGGHQYLLARIEDKYYAADNLCPHMGGNLSGGKLDGSILTCPRHHSQFDLTGGRNLRWTDWTGLKLAISKLLRSPRSLQTHELKIEGNKILLIGTKVLASKKA
jgi:3-phenylpropionate/trans-cinnamate dioxygenase ferredoxin component